MASVMQWRPVADGHDFHVDTESLKMALRKRHGITGRSEPLTFGTGSLSYLQGLADGGVVGAAELKKLVEKYNKVEVWEES